MDTVTTFSKPEISQHDLKSGHNIWNMRLFKKNLNSMLDMHTDTLSIQKKQIMLKVPRKLRYKGYVSPLGCCAFNVLPQSAVQPVCSPAFTRQPAGTYVHEGRSEASGKLLRVYLHRRMLTSTQGQGGQQCWWEERGGRTAWVLIQLFPGLILEEQ